MDTGTNSSLPGDVLDRISGMEKIFDEAQEIVHSLEQAIAAYKDFQPEIQTRRCHRGMKRASP